MTFFSIIDISERLYTSDLRLETAFITSFDKERVVLRDAATSTRLIHEGEGLKVRERPAAAPAPNSRTTSTATTEKSLQKRRAISPALLSWRLTLHDLQ